VETRLSLFKKRKRGIFCALTEEGQSCLTDIKTYSIEKEGNVMSVIDINMGLFLQNVRAALANQQSFHAMFLLDYAIKLAEHASCPLPLFPLDVAIGLHQGRVRAVNEDCVLALQGVFPDTGEALGLFLVADGMGGHAHGQEAAHLAIQTILEHVFPFLVGNHTPSNWESILAEGIHQANRVIHLRNQSMEQAAGSAPSRSQGSISTSHSTSQIAKMGTTMTAVLLVGEIAYIANVGDSRTYLYSSRLSRITKDHSLVAQLLADGILGDEEEIYSHPKRNRITRAVGTDPSVEVDTFVHTLPPNAILLLCSDGLWEMTRDRKIEEILASPWANASFMTSQLVQLANNSGGADNIGCIVIQLQKRTDISAMETTILDSVQALTRLVLPA
jgi:PPM family protein phosphatase